MYETMKKKMEQNWNDAVGCCMQKNLVTAVGRCSPTGGSMMVVYTIRVHR